MRAFIRSNALRVLILLWFFSWLVFVMPGHKRGIVTLPGAEIAQTQAEKSGASPSCCEPTPSCCRTLGQGCTEPHDGPVDPAKHCAICFLKSHMTDPPAVAIYTPYLGELDELAYLIESSAIESLVAPKRVRGRAPPA